MTLRKKESKAWAAFNSHIDKSKLKVERTETAREAFPDVIIQNRRKAIFLIENKAIAAWPKRDSTFPLLRSFEPGQMSFLRSWCQWGGMAYVLLHVGEGIKREVLLLSPMVDLFALTREELREWATQNDRDSIIYLWEHSEP
jgi:hypothetical protein